MIRFDIEFYDDDHRDQLRVNCEKFDHIVQLVEQGYEVEKEELFSYSMFVYQKRGVPGWETYNDLRNRLPSYRTAWEDHFNFSEGGVASRFSAEDTERHLIEAMGVGASLSVTSRVYGLTEADWAKISTGPVKTLDFSFASTGTRFVEVEAKGSIVPLGPEHHESVLLLLFARTDIFGFFLVDHVHNICFLDDCFHRFAHLPIS